MLETLVIDAASLFEDSMKDVKQKNWSIFKIQAFTLMYTNITQKWHTVFIDTSKWNHITLLHF